VSVIFTIQLTYQQLNVNGHLEMMGSHLPQYFPSSVAVLRNMCLIKTFYHTISLGMIRAGSYSLNPEQFVHFWQELGSEIAPLIHQYLLWYPHPSKDLALLTASAIVSYILVDCWPVEPPHDSLCCSILASQ
jgi:hypothetical protein